MSTDNAAYRNSRTVKVTINTATGLICQVVNLILSFVSRTCFIYLMGVEYLGVNGLFSNILYVLSFAELGIGNAIIFSMYKPLAARDEIKLAALIGLFRKAYVAIGAVVALCGLCLIPFLQVLVRETPDIKESITLIYVLFLINAAASYFMMHKRSIITADQKNYIVLGITESIHFLQVAAQLSVLFLTHNYILFLLIQIVGTLLVNAVVSVVANRMYPFIKEEAPQLPEAEKNKIFTDVKALAVYKFGSVILNGTANILASALCGVISVGLVSNYLLLTTACNTLLGRIVEGFTASIGNLNAVSCKEKKEEVFKKVLFISSWLYGFASVGLAVVCRPFISVWIGDEYLLDELTCIAIVFGFYVQGVHYTAYTYRTTLGYFVQGRLSPLAAAILNIVLAIALFRSVGLCGIFLATPIARLLTTGIVDPFLVYKKGFAKSPIHYYVMYCGYLAIFTVIGVICSLLVDRIQLSDWLGVFAQIMMVTVVFNGLMLTLFWKTTIFRDIRQAMLSSLLRRRHS